MNQSRWQQIESIYNAALEKTPEARARFLSEKCGEDIELRTEVDSLLAANNKDDRFLSEPDYELGLKILAVSELVFEPGQTIGNYEILKLLGRGGMGEVYLSKDARLGRLAALKVMPRSVISDADGIRRFTQEARAASALNHPNILTIYEINESENLSFIVSEYVEGESLRARLKREYKISLPELREISLQIAAALSAAHRAGIVHRDIKPENIMVREDGLIKVLDFGLAKLVEDSEENFIDNEFLKTEPGMIMGTVGYMSPEQVRGKKTDERSDIWSFGVVLYEMLTGKPPFEGNTKSDIIAAILKSESPVFEEHFPENEKAVRQIIHKALRKNPSERYQTMPEMAFSLKNVCLDNSHKSVETDNAVFDGKFITDSKKHSTSESISTQLTDEDFIKTERRKNAFLPVLVSILAVIVLGSVYIAYRFSNNLQSSNEPLKITRISDTGKTVTAAISPDGKYVAHAVADAGKQSIWLKNLATNSNVELVAPKEAAYPAITFSKDGDFIYFVQNNGELFQIPVLGGEPKKVLSGVNSAISFSPDGRQFTFVRSRSGETALMIAETDGSGEKQIAGRKKPEFLVGPAWSPDGKVIAVSNGNTSSDPLANIIAFSTEGENERMISTQKWRAIWQPVWISDGSGLIVPAISDSVTDDSLQIYFFSASGGESHRITNDLNNYGDVSLSADSKSLVTIRFEQRNNIWFLPQGKTEESRLVTNNVHAFYRFIAAMPDGRIIYTSQEDSNSGRKLWLINSDGSNVKQLTKNHGDDILPCATADGRYIVFASNRADMKTYHLWRINADGSEPIQLTNGDGERGPVCSPDGQTILYSTGGPDVGPDKSRLRKISINGGESVQLTEYPSGWKDVSPDGKFIALRCKSDISSPFKLAIISSEDGKPVKSFDIKGNSQIRWMPDGSSISFVKSEKGVSNIWTQPLSGEPPRQLTKFTAEEVLFFDWTKNGDIICTRGYEARDPVLIGNFK